AVGAGEIGQDTDIAAEAGPRSRRLTRGNAHGFRLFAKGREAARAAPHVYGPRGLSGREGLRARAQRGSLALADPADHGRAQEKGTGRGFVEPVLARVGYGRRAQQSRICAAM